MLNQILMACGNKPTGKQAFVFTGSDQSFVVPQGVTQVTVKMWGAAGHYGAGIPGCAAGYTEGVLAVTPGETIAVIVGEGGDYRSYQISIYGGGGLAAQFGGNGGGRSAIRRGSTELATAGGGGGAGNGSQGGGQGGGNTGNPGASTLPGGGGTQSAGGSPNGAQFQGGVGLGTTSGGGGGGGWFGGGGGDGNYGDGGGGSGYVGGLISGTTSTGTGGTPPNTSDPDYAAGIGAYNTSGGQGGHGRVVIIW